MRSISAELKLAVAVLAISIAVAVAGARIAGEVFERNVEGASLSTLQGAADAFAAEERGELEKLASTLDAVLANEKLRDTFAAGDREALLALATPLFKTLSERDRVTHWYFITPDRTAFLRVHKPQLRGDRIERITLAKAAETRDLGAGKELGKTAFALRAVRPWFKEGQLVGYVELAQEIDHFLTTLKARTGDEYGLLVKKKYLDEAVWANVLGPRSNTWNDRPDVVVVDTTTFTEGIIDYDGDVEGLPDKGLALGEVIRGERAYVRGIFPVRDAAGRNVGGLFVLHDFTAQHGAVRAGVLQTFLVLLALAVGAGVGIFVLVHLLVFRRLERLRRALESQAAAEAMPPGRVVRLRSEDELGRLEALFERVLFPSRGREPRAEDGSGVSPRPPAAHGDR